MTYSLITEGVDLCVEIRMCRGCLVPDLRLCSELDPVDFGTPKSGPVKGRFKGQDKIRLTDEPGYLLF